tara:strand:+ start:14 stop:2986 length:2973 start_codon:yes stop_codon:yes gene_type:complete
MNKENNKKLKKYKGNRLKAAIGGVPKAPVKTKKSFMSIQKEEGGKENLPTPTPASAPGTGPGIGPVNGGPGGGGPGGGGPGNQQGEPKDPPNGEDTVVRNGFIFAWNGYIYVNTGQEVDDTTDENTDEETPYVPKQGATDPNRTARVQATGTSAEAIAKGDFETAGINIPKIPDAKTLIDPETGLPAATTELDASSEAFKMDNENITGASAATVSTPESTENVSTTDADQADETIGQDLTANKMTAQTVSDTVIPVDAAQGTVTQGKATVEEGTITGEAKSAMIDEAEAAIGRARNVDAVISGNAFVPEVKNSGVGVAATPEAEKNERAAITGTPADDATAAQIIGTVGYEASKSRVVTGQAAKGAAASMIAQTANIPDAIAAAIVEDPATMTAQIASEDVEVQAAVAALPTEALVSSQMESLLGGMEDGNIPTWAKPAVDAVNAGMAQRGLSVSTVGRDSLFNAIIQSAMPMAQSNAQALQTRAAQNLSNQQQANLQESTQEQQLRLQNLANRQDAASQTAQMSQQMKTMQSQFRQQAVLTTADQQQQTRMQNLQNQQNAAVLNSQQSQAINAQNLGNDQQINLAELQIEAQTEGANQNAENQAKLAEMQVAADFLSKNAGFKQQMELANLSNEQQMELANLSSLNQASSENLSAAQQTELANLNAQMNTNINNSKLANAMGVAQLSVDQQRAMQNAGMVANMDMAKFTTEQQVELSNSKFMQTVQIQNMNAEQQAIMQKATAMASMDIANLNVRERLAVENAKNFLTMDMANLNNNQQANMMKSQQAQQRLLSDQAAQNAAEQFNATSANQTDQFMASMSANMSQFNTAQTNNMTQFNNSQKNAAEARRVGNEAEAARLQAQLNTQVSQFNSAQSFEQEKFNTANETAIAQSNVAWRRQANTVDTAAQNAVNQQNAQNAFGLTTSAQNFLWQELRDEADFNFRRWDNDEQRKASLLISALGNETGASQESNWNTNLTAIKSLVDGWLD